MAVEIIQRLAVEVGANIKAFRQKMATVVNVSKTVQKRFGSLGKRISAIGQRVGAAAGKFRKAVFSMKGAILGLVTGLVLKKIVNFVNTVVNLGDQFAKTAKKIGIGVETLSGLKFAADLAGTSFQAVTGGFRRLASAAFDANEGLAESQRAFEALGIEVTDSEGNLRSLEDLFFDSADALQALTSDTERAALAQDLFGRAGLDLIPLLRQGSKEIRKQIKLAKELGITFSVKDAKAAEEFKDQMTILKAALFGLSSGIVKEVVPAFTEFFKVLTVQFRSTAGEGESFATSVGKFIKGLLFVTIGAVELMKTIWNGLKIIWFGLQAAFVGLQAAFVAGFIQILDGLRKFITKFQEPFDSLFLTILEGFKQFSTLFITALVTLTTQLLSTVSTALSRLAGAAADIPIERVAKLAVPLSKAALSAARAAGSMAALGENAKDTINSIEGFRPAKTTLENIDKAILSFGDSNEQLRQRLQGLKEELDGLAESEAIPFWIRAKEKIVELNEAILANEERLRSQQITTEETANQNQSKLGETAQAFRDLFNEMGNLTKAFTSLAANAISQMALGIGNAIARAIVFGESFAASIKQVFKELAASIIAQLVQIIIVALIAQAALSFFGIGAAPTNVAKVASGAKTALGSVAGIIPLADGGIVTRPTAALIGEGGPEAVIPLDRAGGMLGGRQQIIVMLDKEVLTEAVVTGMPEFVRISTGSEF